MPTIVLSDNNKLGLPFYKRKKLERKPTSCWRFNDWQGLTLPWYYFHIDHWTLFQTVALSGIAQGRHFIQGALTSPKIGLFALWRVSRKRCDPLKYLNCWGTRHACMRMQQKAVMMYRIVHGLATSYLTDMVTEQVGSKIYDLRNWKFNLEISSALTSMFRNSFAACFAFTDAWIWNVLADHSETATIR